MVKNLVHLNQRKPELNVEEQTDGGNRQGHPMEGSLGPISNYDCGGTQDLSNAKPEYKRKGNCYDLESRHAYRPRMKNELTAIGLLCREESRNVNARAPGVLTGRVAERATRGAPLWTPE